MSLSLTSPKSLFLGVRWLTVQSNLSRGGYTLQAVREVRCVFGRRLNVANVLDFLIAAGNSFRMVGAEKLKKCLLKLAHISRITAIAATLQQRKKTVSANLQCTIVGSTMPVRYSRTLTTKSRKSELSSGTPWSGHAMYCICFITRSSLPVDYIHIPRSNYKVWVS